MPQLIGQHQGRWDKHIQLLPSPDGRIGSASTRWLCRCGVGNLALLFLAACAQVHAIFSVLLILHNQAGTTQGPFPPYIKMSLRPYVEEAD